MSKLLNKNVSLSVLGSIIANGTSNTLGSIITTGGNVGIRTTSPTSALQVVGDIAASGTLYSGTGFMFRNKIINGDMRIAQRGTSSTTGTGNSIVYGCVDRFQVTYNITVGGFTQLQNTLTSSDAPFAYGLRNSYRVTASTACTNYSWILPEQVIEGYNITDFNWGTNGGTSATLSFWLRTNVSTGSLVPVTIRNSNASSAWWSYNTTVSVTSQNAWQYVTITIAAPPSNSTWNSNTNLQGIEVMFGAYQPSSLTTSPNTWQNGNLIGTSTSTNVWATLNNNIEVTGVQIEKGIVATPFEFRPYPIEFQLCQRYYYVLTNGVIGYIVGSTAIVCITLPIIMRTSPTYTSFVITQSGNGTLSAANGTIAAGTGSTYGLKANLGLGAGITATAGTVIENAGPIYFSAEL